LLRSGQRVVGLDNLNAYYDPRLKEAIHAFISKMLDLADRRAIKEIVARRQFPVVVRRGGGTR
jgi:UDP-glucuronate 4-epimerase